MSKLIFNDHAFRYAEMGLKIAPVAPGGKHPCIADWPNQATHDLTTVQSWASTFPTYNIGAVTGPYLDGYLIVIDMDVKRPPINGIQTKQKWEIINGPLPETLTAVTPSGGMHLFFKADRSGLKHSGKTSGIDIQADGAFIMLPPSAINGKAYSFVNPDCPIAAATEDVYRFISYVMAIDSRKDIQATTTATSPEDEDIRALELKPVIAALNAIPCKQLSYDDWLHIGAALHNAGATVDVWDQWSQTDPARYEDGVCESKWRSFETSKLNWNAGTIFKIAKRYGYNANHEQRTKATPRLICANDIPYEPPRWAFAPYFQRGKGTLIQGDNGAGKTAFMMGIAAHVTTGVPLLGLEITTPGDVLILSVEDDLPVLRGRLEANGADLSKCHFLDNAAGITFNSPEVEEAVRAVNAKLIIFDPFQAFLGAKIDMTQSNETRPELAKLFAMCDRNDTACAIISHMGKSRLDKSPVNRSLGSVDIPAAMRSILELTENPNAEGEKVMVHIKCSNAPRGPSIAYRIGDRGGVHWTGFSPLTPDDLTTVNRRKEKGTPYESEPLVSVFKALMKIRPAGGFWSYNDVKSEGSKILGHPPFDSVGDLRRKLDAGLARELQIRENLIVSYGEVSHGNVRGIKIEPYNSKS